VNGLSDYGIWSTWIAGGSIFAASAASLSWLFTRRRSQASAHTPSYQIELLDSLYNNSPVVFAVIDRQGRFLDINRDPIDLIGYTKQEMAGQPFVTLIDADAHDETMQVFGRTLKGNKCSQDIRIIHKQGHPIDLNINTSPLMRRNKVIGILVFIQDISERKRSLDRVRYIAYYDDMTGLPNRRFFSKRLEEKLKQSKDAGTKAAVCYLDVDRFKLVKASFGRDFSDMLLLQIAERLTRCVPDAADLARVERDEFVVMFHRVEGEEDIVRRVENLMSLLDKPFELSGVPVHISISVGVAICDSSTEDAGKWMKRAYTALHRVKENGKSHFLLHTPDMDDTALQKLTIQHELYRAIQQQEFLLYYQPQFNLMTGEMVGMEALLRWQHPDRGIISPGEFISAAEESGIIVQLGEWVIEEACRQNKAWQDAGLRGIPVSVNLSLRQFAQRNLTDKVAGVLQQTGLAPRYLELEVTESMTMDVERASQCLLELTNLGVRISIDDFGTGYSSFHYLKNLPISRLKIDRSFIRDILSDSDDAAIVAAIITMAHTLKLQVIAEGVECEEQLRFLRGHRCDEMQGYFGSPPLPPDRMEQLLKEKQSCPVLAACSPPPYAAGS
jgi:diguanylate cyclase (GGDEF)-like protein/PAS domain S-box-containing protein